MNKIQKFFKKSVGCNDLVFGRSITSAKPTLFELLKSVLAVLMESWESRDCRTVPRVSMDEVSCSTHLYYLQKERSEKHG